MTATFKKAHKRAVKLRAAIDGPTGAGKTLSALRIARGLVGTDGSIAVIDTEHGTSEKFYADQVAGGFDMAALTKYQPTDYVAMIDAAAGYDVLIIDSLSHAWEGVLDMVDAKGGRFDAWKDVTPHHKRLVNTLLTFPGHLIVTMRSKMAYEVDKDDKTGKTKVSKLGLKPVQREGLEYEFDLVMDMDQSHRLTVSKSRIRPLADRSMVEPDEKFGAEISALISDGIPEEKSPAELILSRVAELRGGMTNEFLGRAMKDAGIESEALVDDEVYERAKEAMRAAIDARAEDAIARHNHEPAPEVKVLTPAQMRGLHAKAKERGLNHDALHQIAADLFGVESMKDVPSDGMDAILEAIASHEVAA